MKTIFKKAFATILALSAVSTALFSVAASATSYSSYLNLTGGGVHIGETRKYDSDYYYIAIKPDSFHYEIGYDESAGTSVDVAVCSTTYIGNILLDYDKLAECTVTMKNTGVTYSKKVGYAGSGKRAYEFSLTNPWRYGFDASTVTMSSKSS